MHNKIKALLTLLFIVIIPHFTTMAKSIFMLFVIRRWVNIKFYEKEKFVRHSDMEFHPRKFNGWSPMESFHYMSS